MSGSHLDDIEIVIDRFEECWQGESPPQPSMLVDLVSEYSLSKSVKEPQELLSELIRVDLEYRWRRSAPKLGHPNDTVQLNKQLPEVLLLEHYLQLFPELAFSDELVVELITEEYRVRQRWGDQPEHDDYFRRFASYADLLREKLSRADKDRSATESEPPTAETGLDVLESDTDTPGRNETLDATLPMVKAADEEDALSESILDGKEADPEVVAFLSKTKPFSELPGSITTALAAHMVEMEFADDEPLIRQGDQPKRLIIVQDGLAEVRLTDNDGAVHVLNRCGRGTVFGEIALLTQQPTSADVVAMTPIKALVMSAADFQLVALRFPTLSAALSDVIGARIGGKGGVDVLYGKEISGFIIKRRLGNGAMAVVYEAEDNQSTERVALKMMKHRLAYDNMAVKRFHQEAEIVGSLNCPNIVQVRSSFAAHNTFFIVMECCEGPTLSKVIRVCAPLPEPQVKAILGQLAIALREAHGKGVIHRDFKPGNVLFTMDGVAKLADFGLARQLEGTSLTSVSQILGTPRYMPAEQLIGSDVDERADYFAFGCVAFELLVGTPIFDEPDVTSLVRKQLSWSFAENEADVSVYSAELKEVLRNCLSTDRETRTLDMEKVAGWAAPVDTALIKEAASRK